MLDGLHGRSGARLRLQGGALRLHPAVGAQVLPAIRRRPLLRLRQGGQELRRPLQVSSPPDLRVPLQDARARRREGRRLHVRVSFYEQGPQSPCDAKNTQYESKILQTSQYVGEELSYELCDVSFLLQSGWLGQREKGGHLVREHAQRQPRPLLHRRHRQAHDQKGSLLIWISG